MECLQDQDHNVPLFSIQRRDAYVSVSLGSPPGASAAPSQPPLPLLADDDSIIAGRRFCRADGVILSSLHFQKPAASWLSAFVCLSFYVTAAVGSLSTPYCVPPPNCHGQLYKEGLLLNKACGLLPTCSVGVMMTFIKSCKGLFQLSSAEVMSCKPHVSVLTQ